jgi:signal recognition particle subunit SRP19
VRKQEKFIMWPAYFDANKTRAEGRRVPENVGVPSPRMLEIQEATAKLGLEHELVPEKAYPRTPWSKHGMLMVEKQGSKEQVIKRIAKQLQKGRNEASRQ